jgi:hypothetical protein
MPVETPAEPKNPETSRRKYAAPRLKRLGSVRDLTLGSPAGRAADGILPNKMM